MTDPLQVLFVDDEPMVLRSIERLLRARRVPWQVRSATNAQEALSLLEADRFDVIVSDLRMPGVDGAELLRQVRSSHPTVARLVLSGQAATREGLEVMKVAHQCLAKPYELGTLRRMVEGLARARQRLTEPLFAAVSQIASLPSPAEVYRRLREALEAGAPLRESTDVVESDPALTAKIMQLNSSAVIGLGHELRTVADTLPLLDAELSAAFQLGDEVCRPLSAHLYPALDLHAWRQHSVTVARLARALAPPALRGKAFVVGILHDVGYLVDACLDPSLDRAGADHSRLGACLLELWGLDAELVEAVANHHDPQRDAAPLSALTSALYLAEYVISETGACACACAAHCMLSQPPLCAPAQLEHARAVFKELSRA
jgi:putative nucleotidyltransferase with HDIG domain